MKWIACVLVLAAGCDSSDGRVEGANARCAFGGQITDCPDAPHTSEGVCWRLVECGAIATEDDDPNGFDWGTCVDNIDGLTADRQPLVIDCIAGATCDELRTDNRFCFRFGLGN
jgi:hypothetical protein